MTKRDVKFRSSAGKSPDEADSQGDKSKRIGLIELVGSAVVFAIFLILRRFRTDRHGAPSSESITAIGEPSAVSPMTSSSESPTALAHHSDSPTGYESKFSIWPLVVAAGTTLTAFGVVTNVTFSVVGILVFVSGVIGWAGELICE